MKAGQVRAQESIAASLNDLTGLMRAMLAQSHKDIDAIRAEAAQIALVAATKLARSAIAAAPQTEVEAALREAIHQAIGEPRIVLRAAPAIAKALEATVTELAAEEGFDGRVIVAPDAAMQG